MINVALRFAASTVRADAGPVGDVMTTEEAGPVSATVTAEPTSNVPNDSGGADRRGSLLTRPFVRTVDDHAVTLCTLCRITCRDHDTRCDRSARWSVRVPSPPSVSMVTREGEQRSDSDACSGNLTDLELGRAEETVYIRHYRFTTVHSEDRLTACIRRVRRPPSEQIRIRIGSVRTAESLMP